MSIYDRPYWNEPQGGGMGRMSMSFPRLTPGVKFLLIANIAIFILQLLLRGAVERYFALTLHSWWQIWRYVTFQFLHSGVMHILLNMLGVYFLGTTVERAWGTKRFMRFYLGCGIFAGVAFEIIGRMLSAGDASIVGASGGVFGLLLLCAVYFPQFVIFILFFPVPIRIAAVIVFALAGLNVLAAFRGQWGDNVLGDVAHLGGAAAAAFYIWVLPRLGLHVRQKQQGDQQSESRSGTWKKKIQAQQDFDSQIDEILEKIKTSGIGSLTSKEQKLLKEATRRQREKDRQMRRM